MHAKQPDDRVSVSPLVHLSELLDALGWVSGTEALCNAALISRESGEIHWTSTYGDVPDADLPEDIDDPALYVAVPDRDALRLGQPLVRRFVREEMPEAAFTVHEIFARPGAYRRFKAWLDDHGHLPAWYAFEERETAIALRDWAESQGIRVLD